MYNFGRILLIASLSMAAAACASTSTREYAEVKPIGPAKSCLQLSDIRSSNVVDDKTIDFTTRNGKVYRNSLPNSCPQLGFEKAFSYATSINQLCSVDIITVYSNGSSNMRGASCGLGQFTPINPTKAKKKS